MTAGSSLPAFTATYSGFVKGGIGTVLSGAPKFTTTATSSSGPGNYPITVSQGTLSAANYTFAFVGGTLSVVTDPSISLSTSYSVSGSAGSGYTVTITVANNGSAAVTNVKLTSATLGSTGGSSLPISVGTIAAGGSAVVPVNFPGSAGNNGAGAALKFGGTCTGGSFSTSIRSVTLP